MLNVWLETCWYKPPKIDIGNTIKIQRNQTNKSAHRAENAKLLEDRVRKPEVIQSTWA